MSSELPVERQIARAMTLYERGIIRHEECVDMIAGGVTRPGFFECLQRLPTEVVEELRKIASQAPAHPEDLHDGTGLLYPMTEGEFEAHRRRRRLLNYWQAKLLREHFFPDQPLPPFEPRRRVGTVSDSMVVDNSVVLFGVEMTYLIRNHPVHCVPPSGKQIVTSVVRQCYVRGLEDTAGNAFQRRFGRFGLFLGANVRSPSEVPCGTEVWVDRSATSTIPSPASLS